MGAARLTYKGMGKTLLSAFEAEGPAGLDVRAIKPAELVEKGDRYFKKGEHGKGSWENLGELGQPRGDFHLVPCAIPSQLTLRSKAITKHLNSPHKEAR